MKLAFKKGNLNNLDQTSIEPGTIYLASDTQNLYLDDEDFSRYCLTDLGALRFEVTETVRFGEPEETEEDEE